MGGGIIMFIHGIILMILESRRPLLVTTWLSKKISALLVTWSQSWLAYLLVEHIFLKATFNRLQSLPCVKDSALCSLSVSLSLVLSLKAPFVGREIPCVYSEMLIRPSLQICTLVLMICLAVYDRGIKNTMIKMPICYSPKRHTYNMHC